MLIKIPWHPAVDKEKTFLFGQDSVSETLKGSQLLESNDAITKQDVSGMQTRPPDEQHPEIALTRGDRDVTSPKNAPSHGLRHREAIIILQVEGRIPGERTENGEGVRSSSAW